MKITLNDVTNIDALSVINDNFDKIEQELQNKVLYRANPIGEPNSVNNDIDMNGKGLLNVGDIVSVYGRWATIDEVEAIKDQVEGDVATVAADKAIVLGYRNTAQTAAADAQIAYDNFDDRYLGAKTSDPFVDNDGNALLTGALYYRTSGTPIMRVYNGTTWQDVGSITTTTTNLIDPSLYSSQAEAELGVNNTKVITPLSAKQAIDKQVKEGFTTTGPIVLPGDASAALQAVPKQQLDTLTALLDQAFPPGTIAPMASISTPSRWLLIDGKTIGNASSGATARANADTFRLFEKLWAFPALSVPIFDSMGAPSTRGVSAAADFAANKRLALFSSDGGAFLRMWSPSQTTDVGRVVGSTQVPYAGVFSVGAESDDGDLQSGSLRSVRSLLFNGIKVISSGVGGGVVEVVPGDTRPFNLAIPYYIFLGVL